MEHAKCPPLTLVLRRFEHEVVELLPANPPMGALPDQAAAACRIGVRTDGDTQIYHVVLPDHLMVRPVDWKRFSYDHTKVKELLLSCVRDNLLPLGIEPWSEAQKERAEITLRLALGDLSSMFDLKSVRCECQEGGRVRTTIEGEHKNGERLSYGVEVALF